MSISVYSQQQDLNVVLKPTPEHDVTRRLSIRLLKTGMARRVGQNAVQLTSSLPWRQIKRLARFDLPPRLIDLSPAMPIRDYPAQLTCMEEAFQRCTRYPVQFAKDQRSWAYSWEQSA